VHFPVVPLRADAVLFRLLTCIGRGRWAGEKREEGSDRFAYIIPTSQRSRSYLHRQHRCRRCHLLSPRLSVGFALRTAVVGPPTSKDSYTHLPRNFRMRFACSYSAIVIAHPQGAFGSRGPLAPSEVRHGFRSRRPLSGPDEAKPWPEPGRRQSLPCIGLLRPIGRLRTRKPRSSQ
jgi:hypothetical protein